MLVPYCRFVCNISVCTEDNAEHSRSYSRFVAVVVPCLFAGHARNIINVCNVAAVILCKVAVNSVFLYRIDDNITVIVLLGEIFKYIRPRVVTVVRPLILGVVNLFSVCVKRKFNPVGRRSNRLTVAFPCLCTINGDHFNSVVCICKIQFLFNYFPVGTVGYVFSIRLIAYAVAVNAYFLNRISILIAG